MRSKVCIGLDIKYALFSDINESSIFSGDFPKKFHENTKLELSHPQT